MVKIAQPGPFKTKLSLHTILWHHKAHISQQAHSTKPLNLLSNEHFQPSCSYKWHLQHESDFKDLWPYLFNCFTFHMNVGNVLMKLQKTTMKSASCFLNSCGRQHCVSRETKSILHERKLSAFHAVIGATFNILYINPDTAEKCRAYWYLDILFAAFENEAALPAAPLHLCSFVWTHEKSTWNWWKFFVQAVCSELHFMQMGCQDCPWMTEWWNIVSNV